MDLKEGKKYVVSVATKFEGEFKGFETHGNTRYAVFQTAGVTDRGSVPYRTVPVGNIVSFELTKQ